ncbi:MAG: hypothetical protein ACJ72N_17020 [Labedaea sp.]
MLAALWRLERDSYFRRQSMVRRRSARLDKVTFLGVGVLVAQQIPPLLAVVACGFAFALVGVFGLVAVLAGSGVRRNAAYNVMYLLLDRSTPHICANPTVQVDLEAQKCT